MIGLLGIIVLLGIAILFSENRKNINRSVVARAFVLQVSIGVLILYLPAGQDGLRLLASKVQNIVDYANTGTDFIFAGLASEEFGFVIALRVLPVIIFVSALVSLLYYVGFMQLVIRFIGGALRRVIGVTRLEGLASAANIFIGMIEAPLAIRPYLQSLTRSQLFAVLAGGLSSVTGAMLLAYSSLGIDLGYLIAAAFMAAPGGLLMAKLLVPEKAGFDVAAQPPLTGDYKRPANFVEAIADGTASGLKIALNVGAMLLTFVALLALLNGFIGWIGQWFGFESLSLEYMMGLVLSPLMYLLGIPWEDAVYAGNLVGQKTILNEFLAYLSFAQEQENLTPQSRVILTFALCGFANLSALGILMGGIASLLPERKSEIAVLGPKAVIAGTLSNLMSASIAGILFYIAPN